MMKAAQFFQGGPAMEIKITLNGKIVKAQIEPDMLLIDFYAQNAVFR